MDRSQLVDEYVVADRDSHIPENTTLFEREFEKDEDLLESKVGDLVRNCKLVEAMSDAPLLEAFDKIVEKSILSVPIYSVEKQNYIGFLDLVDIVYHFLDTLSTEEFEDGFDKFKHKFETDECHTLMNVSNRDPFKILSLKASVRAAANLIDQWGVHRVPLVDETGDCVSVLSQSRLAQLFATHIGLFPFAAQTIGDLKLGIRDVYQAHKSVSAHVAFKQMRDHGSSALAIVDDEGCLVDVLSVSDLRLLGQDMSQIHRVTQTVEEFAAYKTNKMAPITALPNDTVAYVAQRFTENKIHRIYVTDKQNKPIGVIGLGDFIRLFITNP